jgi:hypothetical protein
VLQQNQNQNRQKKPKQKLSMSSEDNTTEKSATTEPKSNQTKKTQAETINVQ